MLQLGRILPSWLLSDAEAAYIKTGVAVGVREDGREPLAFRNVKVERGVIPHAHGSARVAHVVPASPRGRVVAGVKFDVQPIVAGITSCLTVSVSLDQVVPAEKSRSQREVEDQLASALRRALELGEGFSPSSSPMIVQKDALCWKVHLHVTVETFGGSIFECSQLQRMLRSATRRSAISCEVDAEARRVPRKNVFSGRFGCARGNPFDVSMCPLSVTLSYVNSVMIVDALPRRMLICASLRCRMRRWRNPKWVCAESTRADRVPSSRR